MSWLQVKNNAEGSLNGAITNVATSMVVTSAAPFPATTPFRLTIESEIVEVTNIAGTTFTITRGVEDTTGAAHADLTPVYLNILASHIQQIQAAFLGGTKVKTETRDMTLASGDVAYTGYGFRPVALLVYASALAYGAGVSCHGFVDPSKNMLCWYLKAATVTYTDTAFLIYLGGASAYQTAIVKSYDADGFTLTWTKTSNPSQTATILVVAFSG